MESSASLPPSTAAETDQNIPCGGVAEESGNENHPSEGELPPSTDTVNNDGNGIEHHQTVSLEIRPSESDTTNASTTPTLPETQGTEQQANQSSQQTQVPQQLHNQRSQQQEQQQQQQQPQAQQEPEREVVLPATDTSMSSQKPMFVLRPVHKYIDIVCICISVLAYLLETTLNAALAIFGIGVGVGLVLGDSFRATLPLLPAVQASQQQQTAATTNINANSTMTASGVQEMSRSVPNSLPAQ